MKRDKLVHGVGVNDADYVLNKRVTVEGYTASGFKKQKSVWKCPFYVKWAGMLERCYSLKWHKKKPSYRGCTVCEEWLLFSTFKAWMKTQDWEGKQLDKDILQKGNKVYSPHTCVFVTNRVNGFFKNRNNDRGRFLIGAVINKQSGRYVAHCSDPFNKRNSNLGSFDTEIEAHLAWKKRKHEYACILADSDEIGNEVVAAALRRYYSNYDILEDHIR